MHVRVYARMYVCVWACAKATNERMREIKLTRKWKELTWNVCIPALMFVSMYARTSLALCTHARTQVLSKLVLLLELLLNSALP